MKQENPKIEKSCLISNGILLTTIFETPSTKSINFQEKIQRHVVFHCLRMSHSLSVLHKWDEASSKFLKLSNLVYHSIS
jgi:hypothetical protein